MIERLRAASGMRICAFWRSVTNSRPRTSTADDLACVRTVAPAASCSPLVAGRWPRESMTTTLPLVSLMIQAPFWASAGAPLNSSKSIGSSRRVSIRIGVSLPAR